MRRLLRFSAVAAFWCLTDAAFALPVIDTPFVPERDVEEVREVLNQFVPAAMDEYQVPGLSLAIIRRGKIIHQQAFGLDNFWTREKLTDDKIFEVASISKPVAAYAALKLVDQGLVELDQPITEYLPDAPAGVTLRHTLLHTSGLEHIGDSGYAEGAPPGQSFAYSAAGYLLAGDLIEKISGQKLEDYLSSQVLEPLGMLRSGYGDYPEVKNGLATPHISTTSPILFLLIFAVPLTLALLLVTWISRWAVRKVRKPAKPQSPNWWKICIAVGFAAGLSLLFYIFGFERAQRYALVAVPVYGALLLAMTLLFGRSGKETDLTESFFQRNRSRRIIGVVVLVSTLWIIWQRHPLPLDYRPGTPAAYAGLRATAVDIAHFLDELMAPTQIDQAVVDEMLRPQVEVNSHTDWGLGIGIQTNAKQRTIWHWGVNFPGYQALLVGYPDQRVGIVVLMNGGPMVYGSKSFSTRGLELARQIVALTFGGEHHDYWLGVQ